MRPFGSNRQGMGQFVGHRLRFARVVGVLVPASRDRIRGKAVERPWRKCPLFGAMPTSQIHPQVTVRFRPVADIGA
jgi:hypothetical protein